MPEPARRRPARTTVALLAAVISALAAVAVVLVAAPAGAAGSRLVGAASGRCLTVVGGSTTAGAAVEIRDCTGAASQAWLTTAAGELRVYDTLCLDAENRGTTAGTRLVTWTCNGQPNQRFQLTSGGTVTQSGLCADVTGAGTANGTPVTLWTCNGQTNQRWTYGGATTPPPTTTPPPAGCTARPVDAAATQPARNVLCYLYSQYGNHILSGQQESTWVSGPDYEMNYIRNNTGKLPAIRGLDRGDAPDFGARALSWWNSGGIPMVGYHMGSPAQASDGYSGSRLRANISAALTSGTADNTRLRQRLDGLAAQLRVVQNGGGAVIFRPWHEAGGTWFWWSMEGGAPYVRLWQYTFDYLTRTQGLHNLVWLLPFNGSPDRSFAPSKAYYDLGGPDTYASNTGPLTSLFNAARNILGSTVPIALHENGPIPDPAQLQSTNTRWVLFNTWHTTWLTDTSANPVAHLRTVYTSPYVITLDELPDLG